MTFRRPARFLNDGVPDFERDARARRHHAARLGQERAARRPRRDTAGRSTSARPTFARTSGERWRTWVAPHDAVSAAIAAAVLIGDRTGLPDETRDALQAAGTYHVIAISGGNIAIVAAAVVRPARRSAASADVAAAVLTIAVLVAFAAVVTAGPSVWRATLMAVAYFAARAIDHRTPVWQAAALAAAVILVVRPLDVGDPGFVLTFGATAALVEGARRGAALLPRAASRCRGSSRRVLGIAGRRSRAAAGVRIGVLARHQRGAAPQPAGRAGDGRRADAATIVTLARFAAVARECGRLGRAHGVHVRWSSSAQLVTEAPWLTARVPPPGAALVVVYYVALTAAAAGRGRLRAAGAVVFSPRSCSLSAAADLTRARSRRAGRSRALRLTVFDVGQGESMLLETPAPHDARRHRRRAVRRRPRHRPPRPRAGAVGSRRPVARRAARHPRRSRPPRRRDRRARGLQAARIWEGIRVPQHLPTPALLATRRHATGFRSSGCAPAGALREGDVQVRVLHPPEPDWERRRVRNDDSVVIEVVYGDVALLLTGDIGADVERSIVPLLTPARIADPEGRPPRQPHVVLVGAARRVAAADRRHQLRPRQPLRSPRAGGPATPRGDRRHGAADRSRWADHDRDGWTLVRTATFRRTNDDNHEDHEDHEEHGDHGH